MAFPITDKAASPIENNPMARIAMHFVSYIQDRRQNPRDDVLTELAHVRHADGELPDVMEIVSHAAVLFGAGQDTTVRLIAAMFRALAEDGSETNRYCRITSVGASGLLLAMRWWMIVAVAGSTLYVPK